MYSIFSIDDCSCRIFGIMYISKSSLSNQSFDTAVEEYIYICIKTFFSGRKDTKGGEKTFIHKIQQHVNHETARNIRNDSYFLNS